MKKTFNLFNIILIALILIGDIFYIIFNDSLLIKSLTSAGFVILGIINLIYAIKTGSEKRKFAITMLIGLVFAMLGDIVLELHFILGAALFAIGHIFYFIAYCFLIPFKAKDLIYGAMIFIPVCLFILLAPILNFGGIIMEIVCIVYALIISSMLGKAISNYIQNHCLLHLILLIGSILFTISDFMLLLNVFADLPRIFGILCLATYYPAECALAYAILLTDKAKSTDK